MGWRDNQDIDIDLGEEDLSDAQLTTEIGHQLQLKGYCVIRLGVDDDKLNDAIDEVVDMKRGGRFEPPPPEVVDGILGPEGSREFAWLGCGPPADSEEEFVMEGPVVQELSRTFDRIAGCGAAYVHGLGFDTTFRSKTMLVRGGETGDEINELTEESCMQWMHTFTTSKLMLVYFMGEGEGTLEMRPFDEESESVELTTRADTLVVLRADSLGHKHQSSSRDYALAGWVMTRDPTGPRGWKSLDRGMSSTMPVAKELTDWAQERLQQLFALEEEDKLEVAVPREWQLMMHHSFFKKNRNPVAVRGEGGHVPGLYDNEVFWKSCNMGCDYLTEVPFNRWDHDLYYDADPNSYLQSHTFRAPGYSILKTSIKHSQFIDGIDLFDNKFFGLSIMEAKGMDPMQRHILETSYEALFHAGYKKKELMTSYIAVFTGCTNPEWNYIDKEAGACSGTGSSQAITSNRTSFILGMMGPSTSIDCEMASSGMALILGGTAVSPNNEHRTKSGGDSAAACVGGVFLSMTPFVWPRFNAWMNPVGRVCTFDQNANGYVRGECCNSVCLKPYCEKVDDELIIADAPCIGTMVGWRMTSNGRSASLTAPCGPAEQEAVHESVRHAGITPLDMDGMECHGIGSLLHDGVEVSSLAGVLRGVEGGEKEALILGSVKTNTGAQCEACGITAFLKVIYNIMYANNAPSLHLKQLNPHLELGEGAVFVNNEAIAYRNHTVFHGVSSRGLGGTNINMVMWYMADERRVYKEATKMDRQPFAFWPGGGGMLEGEAKPLQGYYIIGSWCQWETPDEMERGNDGSFVYTISVGENNFETFQIWMDGEDDKVLHPNRSKAPPGSAVYGPSHASETVGSTWMIDGRSPLALADGGAEAALAADGVLARTRPSAEVVAPIPVRHAGHPGDRYEVKLMIAGKYRAVTWKKVASDDDAVAAPVPAGTYYISGSFSDWTFKPLVPSETVSGLYSVEVGPLKSGRGDFQIVRNKDWEQVFYPPVPGTDASLGGEVLGPDQGTGMNWNFHPKDGDVYKVEFQRSLEVGKDLRKISWSLVRSRSLEY